MKKIVFIILLFSLLLGGSGCMRNSNLPNAKEFIAYLSEKYDDSFTYYGPAGGSVSSTTKEMFFTSEKYPEQLIWAKYYPKSGYVDNYLSAKYYTQTCELAAEIVGESFGETQCFFFNDTFMDGVSFDGADQNSTFEEFIASKEAALSLTIIVDIRDLTADLEEITSSLKEAILSHGVCFVSVKVFFTEDYDLTEGMTRTEYETMRYNRSFDKHYLLNMVNKNEFSKEEWVK